MSCASAIHMKSAAKEWLSLYFVSMKIHVLAKVHKEDSSGAFKWAVVCLACGSWLETFCPPARWLFSLTHVFFHSFLYFQLGYANSIFALYICLYNSPPKYFRLETNLWINSSLKSGHVPDHSYCKWNIRIIILKSHK